MQTGFKDCSLAGFISRSSAVWSRLKRRRNRIYLISPTIKIFQSWPPTPVATRSRISIPRSEEHTSELQSLMRISYAVFCLKKKKKHTPPNHTNIHNQTQQLR